MKKNSNMIVFGLSSSKHLSKTLCEKLKIDEGTITTQKFADGEILVKPNHHVRGMDVLLIQSTGYPVNENFMELLIAIDALKRASAKTINVVVPYFGYSRQDRKSKPREPITFKLIANMLENAGATRILTWDIHSAQTQGFFDIPFDSIEAVWILLNAFIEKTKINNFTIVAPDYGGIKRNRDISLKLQVPLAIIDKRRPSPNEVEICNILGDVKDKNCVITDDMIDTGGTIIAGAKLLIEKGAKTVSVLATHALFNRDAIKNLEKAVKDKIIDHIFVTDTIERPSLKFVNVISVANQLKNLYEIYETGAGSMSTVMDNPTKDIIKKILCIVDNKNCSIKKHDSKKTKN